MHKAMIAGALAMLAGAITHAATTADADYTNWPTHNGNDLELTWSPSNGIAQWRLWSPNAEAAQVMLYKEGRGGRPFKTIDMTRSDSGTWTASASEVAEGTFYTFRIKTADGNWLKETPGAWAKAVGVNGERAAVIDFAATNPEGWCCDRGPAIEAITDAVIYEMHHRDMSMSPTSGIENKGKFLALTEHDTKTPTYGDATGIDHLKELGVTHVHILPSYDYNSVDESQPELNQYNWGYDPWNYNAPEGSYSTNPYEPAVRIKEMKQMIKALHDAGIGVIMDVVYNHTALNDDSNLSLTSPGYYYRHRPDGSYSDASGCGNETASDRQQMRDYIVNSVLWWADEYHIDGFRFDLMAIHDTDTMNEVTARLRQLRHDIFVYGEGWTAGDSPLPVERRALKENVSKMPHVAVFSDDIRDAVKGHYSDASDRGFATGKPGLEETVKIGIVGATPHPQVDYSKGNNSKFAYASAPTQVINYVSCHDDLTLTDKLRHSMPEASDSLRMRAARLAQTIIFTSQGTPFMLAGEEVWRDKKGVHNSYKSPDSINAIDWDHKHHYAAQTDYYCELIKLRKAHPAFRLRTADDVAKHLIFDEIDSSVTPNLVSYSLTDNAGGDEWAEIKVILNGADQPHTVDIPACEWIVIASDGTLRADGLGKSQGGNIEVAPVSATILARR